MSLQGLAGDNARARSREHGAIPWRARRCDRGRPPQVERQPLARITSPGRRGDPIDPKARRPAEPISRTRGDRSAGAWQRAAGAAPDRKEESDAFGSAAVPHRRRRPRPGAGAAKQDRPEDQAPGRSRPHRAARAAPGPDPAQPDPAAAPAPRAGLCRRPRRGEGGSLGLSAGRHLADGRELPRRRCGDQRAGAPGGHGAGGRRCGRQSRVRAARRFARCQGRTRHGQLSGWRGDERAAVRHRDAPRRGRGTRAGRRRLQRPRTGRDGHWQYGGRIPADPLPDGTAAERLHRARHGPGRRRPGAQTRSAGQSPGALGRSQRRAAADPGPLRRLRDRHADWCDARRGRDRHDPADRRVHRDQRAAGRASAAAGDPRLLRVRPLLRGSGPSRPARSSERRAAARSGSAPGRGHRRSPRLPAVKSRLRLSRRDGELRIGGCFEPRMNRELAVFFAALRFFSRLPVPRQVGHSQQQLEQAARYLPLVGVIVGALGAAVTIAAAQWLPISLAILAGMAATLLVTGAFHEDGFADAVDGFGGGRDRERVLEIMKDSRIGSFGAIAVALMLLAKFNALAQIDALGGRRMLALALVAGHPLSRFASTTLIWALDYVREDDSAKSKSLTRRLSPAELALAALFGLTPCLLLAGSRVWIGIGLATAVTVLAAVYFVRRIGGYTGDCLGATQQLAELAFYVGLLCASS